MTVYPALVEEAGVVKEGRFPTLAEAEFQHRRALAAPAVAATGGAGASSCATSYRG